MTTTTTAARRSAFARGTGNSAVFRLWSSRIGRNDRASGLRSHCSRACVFRTAQKGSLSLHLWSRRTLFPHLTRRFVSQPAQPEKIYRRAGPSRVLLTPESGVCVCDEQKARPQAACTSHRCERQTSERTRTHKEINSLFYIIRSRAHGKYTIVNFAKNNVVSSEVISEYLVVYCSSIRG